jgi:hypothetical protein
MLHLFTLYSEKKKKRNEDQALARYSSPQSPMAAIKSLPLEVTEASKALSWSSNLNENTLPNTHEIDEQSKWRSEGWHGLAVQQDED